MRLSLRQECTCRNGCERNLELNVPAMPPLKPNSSEPSLLLQPQRRWQPKTTPQAEAPNSPAELLLLAEPLLVDAVQEFYPNLHICFMARVLRRRLRAGAKRATPK